MEENGTAEVVNLDVEAAGRFLKLLAEHPFAAVVVTDDGEVRVFSNSIEPEHLARIKEVLHELSEGV